MSVEGFIANYPVSEALRGDVRPSQSIKEIRGSYGRSAIGVLAQLLVSHGEFGIKEARDMFTPGVKKPRIEEFPSLTQDSLARSQAAIILGLSIIALEESMIERRFDAGRFCERYNRAVEAGPFHPIIPIRAAGQDLSNDRLKRMYGLAKNGRTLVSFFLEDGKKAIPELLDATIEHIIGYNISLKNKLSDVMEIYKERAAILVAKEETD